MNEDQFVRYLKRQAREYVANLERMFGPRDEKFVFGTIRKSRDDKPRTNYPNNDFETDGCVVDIHIGKYPWDHCCCEQGTWQLAHECVHLLDPGEVSGTNSLEEGLAVWFQDDHQFHDDAVKKYIEEEANYPDNYKAVRDLVQNCMPRLVDAVRDIRTSGTRIRDITADVLRDHLPDADPETISELCTGFQY